MDKSNNQSNVVFKYTVFGVGFGLLFPVIATATDSLMRYGRISFTTIQETQKSQPLHWIIDMAPFILGIVFCLVGIRTVKLISAIQMEKQVALAKEEAEIASKAKSVFLANVAHEIRTPLTAIYGSIRLLKGNIAGELPEEATQLLTTADRNCNRVISLVNEVLDFEKIKSGKIPFDFKVQSFSPIIKQAIESNDKFAQRYNIRYKIRGPLANTQINIDANRMVQVMTNLLSNAAKFSSNSEFVEISLEEIEHTLRVSVTNSGKGIPASYHYQIFNAYSQADLSDSRHQGTGLGLSICKAIIDAHDGKIYFQSEPDVKTTFYVELPALPATVSQEAARE